jgi:pimeloyl-ACP methyl ester carboxylesterase
VKSPTRMSKKRSSRPAHYLRLSVIGAGLTGFAVAYKFALRYREKVGVPHRSTVETSPAEFGLAFELVEIPAGDHHLAGWFVPAESERAPKRARSGTPTKDSAGPAELAPGAPSMADPAGRRPAIVVVHGWESNRGRTFAHVRYLHAAGFHCLVFDVRGHGDSPDETLPVNVPEFAEDTVAAARWVAARPEVSSVGVLGHSMGGAGAIVAASHESVIKAVVSASAPADLVRMTRRTFQMAGMEIPEVIATPLAWFTAAILLVPRHHSVDDASATAAAAHYRGPLLLIHGAQDHGVPVAHLELIARAAVDGRGREGDPPVETLVLPDFGHRWLYEDAGCRRKTATFFARWLGGPVPAATAGDRAAACLVVRPTDPVYGFGAAASKTPPSDLKATFN